MFTFIISVYSSRINSFIFSIRVLHDFIGQLIYEKQFKKHIIKYSNILPAKFLKKFCYSSALDLLIFYSGIYENNIKNNIR